MNSLMIPEYTYSCRFCKEKEKTFDHIFHDCPVFFSGYKEEKQAFYQIEKGGNQSKSQKYSKYKI